MALVAQQLSLSGRGRYRLKEINLSISTGSVTALIGPNGAGKSSLLRCLAGDIPPSDGEVLLEQRALSKWSSQALAQARAVLPQRSNLAFPLRVEEVVRLGRSPFNSRLEDNQVAIHTALRSFSLEDLATRTYNQLSGGEQQRTQLARVWAQLSGQASVRPRYVLLDEPEAGLDLQHQLQLMQAVRCLADQRDIGVVLAIHDLSLAARFADQIILLDQGVVIASGTPDAVLVADTVKAVYGVSAEFYSLRDANAMGIAR